MRPHPFCLGALLALAPLALTPAASVAGVSPTKPVAKPGGDAGLRARNRETCAHRDYYRDHARKGDPRVRRLYALCKRLGY